jgi:hypothetical protein
MLPQSFQKFRLLVIEPLDRLRVRFAFSDHLPDLMCCSATLTFFWLCRAFVQMLGYCPPHDAISPIENSHQLPIEYRHGIPLCDLQQLVAPEQRFMPANCRYPRAAEDVALDPRFPPSRSRATADSNPPKLA